MLSLFQGWFSQRLVFPKAVFSTERGLAVVGDSGEAWDFWVVVGGSGAVWGGSGMAKGVLRGSEIDSEGPCVVLR